jgi:hypothetical protein
VVSWNCGREVEGEEGRGRCVGFTDLLSEGVRAGSRLDLKGAGRARRVVGAVGRRERGIQPGRVED